MIVHTVQPDKKTKEERVREFVKAMQAIEQAMQPFKEQRSELKKNFVENDWLSKSEMKNVIKAYRLMKDETDFAELESMYKKVTGG